MGVYSTFKSSYQQSGIFHNQGNYHAEGAGAAFKALGSGRARPMEGFAHAIKRGIVDNFIEAGHSGVIDNKMRYGGSIISRGGMREVIHDVEKAGSSGLYKLGARRSTLGMFGKAAGKLVAPALFLYSASQDGIGQATKDTVEQGAVFGATRWAWGRAAMAVGNPLLIGAVAVAGAAIGAQKALQAGFDYNAESKRSGFTNPFNDTYGNAATMRQQSLMAIQSSKINGRNLLGQEASFMHMR